MKKEDSLKIVRHSAAHLLAHAIQELYPKTTLTIGPATREGFFYDMLPKTNFKESDLPAIEEKMREIVQCDLKITHEQMPKNEARVLYKDNPFKLELIDGIPGDTVGIARQGEFHDLCRGGHVDSTGKIKHFKLLHISGSYWRADRDGQPLQRITGTAFETAKDFRTYEKKVEDALKYDHRRLGKQLDLFSFHDEGVGFPFFHHKGKLIIKKMISYLRDLLDKADYLEIETPVMLSDDLWKRSGHYKHYKDNMFFSTIEDKNYAVRPMNCPGAILLFKERPRSYRNLPMRLSEFGKVHRFELSGVLHGLFRVRAFTQDDGHIFCTPDQIEEEILKTIEITMRLLKKFGFEDIKVALSTKPEKAMGDDALWDKATKALKSALKKANIDYTINEGDGAFYGPKIDFQIKDSMDREWQLTTIQLDFFQPENFDLEYVTSAGTKARPVMIHRALYGSLERFLGILIEHYKGNLPFWIAPVQVRVLTITDDQKKYAQSIYNKLKESGIRAELDESSDPISGQIKAAQLEKIPWMIVVGNKEMTNNTVTLRFLNGKQEFGISIDELIKRASEENK